MTFAYLALGIAIAVLELRRPKPALFDWFSIFSLSFISFYIVPPLLLSFDLETYGSILAQLGMPEGLNGVVFAYIALSFIGCAAIYFRTRSFLLESVSIEVTDRLPHKWDLYFGVGLVVVALAAQWSFTRDFGGFANTLACAEEIRGGAVEGGYGYARKLLPCAFFGLLSILAFWDRRRPPVYSTVTLIVGVAVIVAAASMFILSGRSMMLATLITVWLYLLYKSRKAMWFFPVMIALIVGVMVLWKSVSIAIPCEGYAVSSSMNFRVRLEQQLSLRLPPARAEVAQEESESESEAWSWSLPKLDFRLPPQVETAARIYNAEFDHRVVSLAVALKAEEAGTLEHRWYGDAVKFGLGVLLPERLTGPVAYAPIERANVELIAKDVHVGFIPPGFLAYGIHSGGLLGLALLLIAYSFSGACVGTAVERVARGKTDLVVVYVAAGWFWGFTVHYGAPESIASHGLIFPVWGCFHLLARHRWRFNWTATVRSQLAT